MAKKKRKNKLRKHLRSSASEELRKQEAQSLHRLQHIDDYREGMIQSDKFQTDLHNRSDGSMSTRKPGVNKAYTSEEKRQYAIAQAREEELDQKMQEQRRKKKK